MLTQLLESSAERDPNRIALRFRGRSLTRGELFDAVCARADELARSGVRTGDGVALLLPNQPDFPVTFFAAASLGAVVIPMNPKSRQRELEVCLGGCRVEAFVCTPALAPVCTQLAGRSGVVLVSEAEPKRATASAARAPRRAIPADAPVLYGFSSGTTGAPKRIARSQGNLRSEADHFVAGAGIVEDDVILAVAPLYHAHGLGNALLAAVRSGARLVLLDRFERREVLDTIASERVSVLPSVPFQLQALASTPGEADLSSLRLCFTAGSPLPDPVFHAFRQRFGRAVGQLYGNTEAGSICANFEPDVADTLGSVGRPMRGVEIAILDDAGQPAPSGTVGQVALRSPAAGSGYVGLEQLTRETFAGGWFRTGDLGELRDGRLWLRGRIRLFIDAPAGKVDPVEVERCVAQHEAVVEAVALGVPARSGGEIVKVVAAVGDAPIPEPGLLRREIVTLCRRQMAEHKVPRIVELRPEIPRSAAGKILRSRLIEPYRGVES